MFFKRAHETHRDPRFTDETIAHRKLAAELAIPLDELKVEPLRKFCDAFDAKANETFANTFKGTIQEKQVKIDSAEIPITIYTPVDANKDKLVIFFHGGAWILCSRKTHQTIVNLLADATKTIWISVEYRLAPEHKYPIWLDDARQVTQHIIKNKVNYGVDETAKIGLAGDSAGAMISASLCHTLKNLDFQILVYGIYDFTLQTASAKEFTTEQYELTPEFIEWSFVTAFHDKAHTRDPQVSVLLNTSFGGVPPALFIVAELDPLRDDSYAYQEALEKAGIKTKLVLVKGVVHGFFDAPAIYPKAHEQVVSAVQEFMASI